MDIIKAFNENNMNIEITIKGTIDNPLFKASDIGEVLGLSNIRQNIQDFDESEKGVCLTDTIKGSQNIVFLTEKGLYKILFKSRKPIAIKFQNWVCDVIKEIRLKGKYELEQKVLKIEEEKTDLIKQRDEAIKKSKHTTETAGYVYAATNLKEAHKKQYKVGNAIDEKNREGSMNTAEKDGCNRIIVKFYTKHRILAEQLIHTYLTCHKFQYNREYFTIDLDLLISICRYFTKIVDQTSEVPMDELYSRLVISESTHLKNVNNNNSGISNINPVTNNDNSINNNITNININVLPEQMKQLKYFDLETYKKFVDENIIINPDEYTSSEALRYAFGKWLTFNNLKSKINEKLYVDNQDFKNEFRDVLEYTLSLPQLRIYRKDKNRITGFKKVTLRDPPIVN